MNSIKSKSKPITAKDMAPKKKASNPTARRTAKRTAAKQGTAKKPKEKLPARVTVRERWVAEMLCALADAEGDPSVHTAKAESTTSTWRAVAKFKKAAAEFVEESRKIAREDTIGLLLKSWISWRKMRRGLKSWIIRRKRKSSYIRRRGLKSWISWRKRKPKNKYYKLKVLDDTIAFYAGGMLDFPPPGVADLKKARDFMTCPRLTDERIEELMDEDDPSPPCNQYEEYALSLSEDERIELLDKESKEPSKRYRDRIRLLIKNTTPGWAKTPGETNTDDLLKKQPYQHGKALLYLDRLFENGPGEGPRRIISIYFDDVWKLLRHILPTPRSEIIRKIPPEYETMSFERAELLRYLERMRGDDDK